MEAEPISKQFQEVLTAIESVGQLVIKDFTNLEKKIKDEDCTAEGLDFLELKNELLSAYMTNLLHVQWARCQGQPLTESAASPSVERLVELRVSLERMRPLEQKLEYKINKLLRLAATGKRADDDDDQFKANPFNLESQLSDESDESEAGDEKVAEEKKGKMYVPPRNTPMYYDDEAGAAKAQRRLEATRKTAMSLNMLHEMREQHSEAPMEIKERGTGMRAKMDQQLQERETYEEDTFTRLNVTKQDRARMKRLTTESSLKDLTRFGDLRSLDHTVEDYMDPAKKKRKSGGKKGGKGSKKKKRFH